jgi:hypothetical protein
MTVTVLMTDKQFCNLKFEELLEFNQLSSEKENGEYKSSFVRNLWVFYTSGFRSGKMSVGSTCDF